MKKARIADEAAGAHPGRSESHVASEVGSFELFAFFQDDNNVYMLMDYIPGGELFSHLRRQGKFSTVECQFFAVEIACAIEYLHKLNVI